MQAHEEEQRLLEDEALGKGLAKSIRQLKGEGAPEAPVLFGGKTDGGAALNSASGLWFRIFASDMPRLAE